MEQNVTDHFPCLEETQPRHYLRLLAWHAPGLPPPAHMPMKCKKEMRLYENIKTKEKIRESKR